MKFSKATNYALHAVLFLTTSAPDRPVGVQQLADRLGVSPTYLSKILTKLAKEGLIESASGAGGGYRLKAGRAEVSFLDIIHAVEGTVSLFECCESENASCLIHRVMLEAEEKMEEHLRQTTLAELVKRHSLPPLDSFPEGGHRH